MTLLFILQRLDAVERPKGGQRDDCYRDAGLDDVPKKIPLNVENLFDVAVRGLTHRAYETNGKHENGEAEKNTKNDLLLKPNIHFSKKADGNCDDCEKGISIAKNVEWKIALLTQ